MCVIYSKVLFNQHKPGFCPAARNYFTVAKDGSVYPCQNLPETPETFIGRLGEPDLEHRLANSPVRRRIDEANRRANELLGEEWYSNFCKICPVYNLSENKSMEATSRSRAKLSERMAAAFVAELVRISRDDALYSKFIRNAETKIAETFEPNVF